MRGMALVHGLLLLAVGAWAWLWHAHVQPLALHHSLVRQQAHLAPHATWLPNYKLALTHAVSGIANNLSGLTYSTHTGHLMATINRPPALAELTTDGQLLRLMPMPQLQDVEGIAHVRGELFAVTEEAHNRVRWVRVPADAPPQLLNEPAMRLPESNFDNLGVEGVAWDAAQNQLLLVQEKWPMRVLMASTRGGTPREWHPHASSPLDADDLASIEVDPRTGHLLLLSDESASIYVYTRDGALISTMPLWAGHNGLTQTIPQAEGMAMDPQGRLYIVSEPNLFYRFEPGMPN